MSGQRFERPRRRLLAAIPALALILAACAPAAPPAPTAAAKPTAAPQPTSAPAAAQPASAAQPTTGAAPAAPPLKPEMQKIRVIMAANKDATNVADGDAFQILQQKYGVESDVNIVSSGAGEAIKTLIANQADFALATYAAGILAVGQQQQIQVVTPSTFAPYFVLLADDSIKGWKDFEGKTVGITATSDSSYFTTVLMMRKNGVDPTKVNWVTVRGTADRASALVAGKIAAGQVLASQSIELTAKQPNLHIVGYPGKDFPNLLFNGYWVRKDFAAKNPGLVQAFTDSMLLAHRDVMDEAKYTAVAKTWVPEIEPDLLSKSYRVLKDVGIWDPNFSRWGAEAGDYTARTFAEYEAVEKYVPFSEWATTTFADGARKRLGEVKQ